MNKELFTQNRLKTFVATLLIGFASITGILAQASFSGNTFNIPVAPGATSGVASGTATVACVGVIANGANVSLQLQFHHTFVGDLTGWLVGPGGQTLELFARNGGGNNNMNVILSDAGTANIGTVAVTTSTGIGGCPSTTYAYSGILDPEGRVNVIPAFPTSPSEVPAVGTFTFANTFTGVNADGTWTLHINDHVGGDAGAVCSWSINFANTVVPTCTFVGGPVLPALNLSTSTTNCVSDPITVPAVTSANQGCTG